ncbi:predicted protein, partial [Haematococcus lacustris]
AAWLTVPGGPVFSLTLQPHAPGALPGPCCPAPLFCGSASKQVLACTLSDPGRPASSPSAPALRLVAGGYTGWVRTLAVLGPWLFSASCNFLLQHDTRLDPITHTATQELFKGDILAMAADPDSHAIFVGTADGCIHGFSINKTGGLSPLAQVAGAHSSRVTGLAVCGAQLYSVGLD